ncbi:exodeoxyribonuclease V subunit alpha [Photobacterium rosenbergii]|uniref:RecBCD enzyme subunit RecD n=1 Tax=Photobacterium rosenbergii TaxID=294936 RepID=A0ABU3ZNS2_9GAMM|nr:exodeoxyribonuclease V subunit alpha [Photobacterium rosenbergii]MDV5171709.1 exodeoxyribonuclease V subunit alpha [Photobacterium rosenbergii]
MPNHLESNASPASLAQLENLVRQGYLRPLDHQFAKFVAQGDKLVALVAALASYELGQGHVCLLLSQLDTARLFGLPAKLSLPLVDGLPEPQLWQSHLAQSEAVSDGSRPTPLVMDGDRVYLNRYWQFEQMVANQLRLRAQSGEDGLQPELMAAKLDELFARDYRYLFAALQQLVQSGGTPADRQREVCDKLDVVTPQMLDWSAIDTALQSAASVDELAVLDALVPTSCCLNWQKVAAAVALTRQFAVISGGPGTGKTTTVAKLLAALVTQAIQRDERDEQGALQLPDIKLVAPTGKAAARLTESIGSAVDSLAVDDVVKSNIPTQSSTIHRLLGAIPNRVAFRHNRDNPLHLDVLVVDEASMVDLPMMARLLDALPPHAKLILLGDRDQLASVEAGAVLGDICGFAEQGYTPAQSQLLGQLTGFQFQQAQAVPAAVADSLCMLQKSYRFHAQSGIGQLAKAINSGKPYQVEQVWDKGFKDLQHHPLSSESYLTMITYVVAFYSKYLEAIEKGEDPGDVLKAFAQVRLLCAVREGDFGVAGLNQRIEKALARKGKIAPGEDTWYVGRPIMISQNDHGLGLYNGDIGIAMYDSEVDPVTGNRPLRVYFEMPDGTIRGVLPSRLPEHDTVYAMTIHKSQGSEFADTLMVLPPDFSPILTRELVYTGVTRAKSKLYMFATKDVLNRSVTMRTERASGLASLLK